MIHLVNALVFIIGFAFYLYILLVMVRFILQLVGADFYNPVSQFVVRVTSPILRPLRRFIPGYGGIDVASLVLMLGLQLLELWLVVTLTGQGRSPGAMMALALGELLSMAINLYIFSIIVQIILSWVMPNTYHPVVNLLYRINEPLLGRARRLLPPIGGLDLSPILVFLGLQLLKILVVAPLMGWGDGPILG